MEFDFREWLHLLTRWFHVVVGIMWIGQTYLFGWMDSSLEEVDDEEIEGRLWMIHSGGFYKVEKQKLAPRQLPAVLHWFKWEAGLTWISGMILLWVVYYLGGGLLDYGADVSLGRGIALGMGTLFGGWFLYDALWRSPLARHETLAVIICFVLVVGVAWGLTHVLSGRAAYIHVGALFGTIMAANVWERILPGQRQLVAAAKAGTAPDPALAAQAKQRSKHNTYMSVPLIFIMISNHFPTASYGQRYNWAMLGVFVLLGWAGRKLMTLAR
jgi:uncharacterized membrane protein